MVSILYKHQGEVESGGGQGASKGGLRSPESSGFNHGGWTSTDSTGKDPGVVAQKVSGSMLSNSNENTSGGLASSVQSSAVQSSTVSASIPTASPTLVFSRKLLDSFRHGNFLISLFYEKKDLCLALYDIAADSELGKWSFCHQKRHQRTFKDDTLSVKVSYRPAAVEVAFTELGHKGFIKRLFGTSLVSKDSWSHYELGCDGAVRIHRPGRELIVS